MENATACCLNELFVDPGDYGIRTVSIQAPPDAGAVTAFDQRRVKAGVAFGDGSMAAEGMEHNSLAEEITDVLAGLKSLNLCMDPNPKRVAVRLMDERTNRVVRQLPSKRMVDLIRQMRDLEGLLFKASA